MTVPHHSTRRDRYSARRHQVETRPVPSPLPGDETKIVWYRDKDVDHAFGAGTTGFLRSKCGEVRFTVHMQIVEGSVYACGGCLAAMGGIR